MPDQADSSWNLKDFAYNNTGNLKFTEQMTVCPTSFPIQVKSTPPCINVKHLSLLICKMICILLLRDFNHGITILPTFSSVREINYKNPGNLYSFTYLIQLMCMLNDVYEE